MVAKAEYVANTKELQQIAEEYTLNLQEALKDVLHITDSVKLARSIGRDYRKAITRKTVYGLAEGGMTTARHYNQVLHLDLNEDEMGALVERLINRQLTTKYHNLTLNQRFKASDIVLNKNIGRSGYVGKELETRQANLVRVFAHPYPFGAHINIDKRIFLSESVRLEHMIAKEMADKAAASLARWSLSKLHTKEDICDSLANETDPETVEFIKRHKLTINPKGVYLIKNIPNIPHPNCQCTIRFFRESELTRGRVRRTGRLIRELVERIIRRRKLTLKV